VLLYRHEPDRSSRHHRELGFLASLQHTQRGGDHLAPAFTNRTYGALGKVRQGCTRCEAGIGHSGCGRSRRRGDKLDETLEIDDADSRLVSNAGGAFGVE
jgi:hypothetical protein